MLEAGPRLSQGLGQELIFIQPLNLQAHPDFNLVGHVLRRDAVQVVEITIKDHVTLLYGVLLEHPQEAGQVGRDRTHIFQVVSDCFIPHAQSAGLDLG